MTFVKVNSPITRSIDGIMKDLLNEFPSTVSKSLREDVLHYPPVNISEDEQAYLVSLSAPGFEKADFKINLESNVLTISTEKKEEKQIPAKVIRREFSNRPFKRSFTIDEIIDTDKISAKYENGILHVALPKKEQVKAGAKEINIQ